MKLIIEPLSSVCMIADNAIFTGAGFSEIAVIENIEVPIEGVLRKAVWDTIYLEVREKYEYT